MKYNAFAEKIVVTIIFNSIVIQLRGIYKCVYSVCLFSQSCHHYCLTKAITHNHHQSLLFVNVDSAIFDVMNTKPLKHALPALTILTSKQHRFHDENQPSSDGLHKNLIETRVFTRQDFLLQDNYGRTRRIKIIA